MKKVKKKPFRKNKYFFPVFVIEKKLAHIFLVCTTNKITERKNKQ